MRRQDEVLRVIDEEPRLLGLRFRSCINLFVVMCFTWGLYLVVVYGLAVRTGLRGKLVLLALWCLAFSFIRWAEKREDVDFLGASLRYFTSRRSRALYAGAIAAPFERHPFEDLLFLSRLLRRRPPMEAR